MEVGFDIGVGVLLFPGKQRLGAEKENRLEEQ